MYVNTHRHLHGIPNVPLKFPLSYVKKYVPLSWKILEIYSEIYITHLYEIHIDIFNIYGIFWIFSLHKLSNFDELFCL